MEDADVRHDESLPAIEVTADVTEDLGSEVNIHFRVDAPPVAPDEIRAASDHDLEEMPLLADDAGSSIFCARVDARTAAKPGSAVRLTVDPSRFHFFDPQTGLAIDAARD